MSTLLIDRGSKLTLIVNVPFGWEGRGTGAHEERRKREENK
jgi:hypothetical protein